MDKIPIVKSTTNKYKKITYKNQTLITIDIVIILENKKVGECKIYNIPCQSIYWEVYDYALTIIRNTCTNVDGYMFVKLFNEIPSYYSGIRSICDARKFLIKSTLPNRYILHEVVKLVKH